MKDKSKRLTVINTSVTEKSDSPGSDSTNRKPSISPIGLNTTGNFLLKSTWNEAWEIKSNEEGRKYIYGKLPLVLQYGLTMYAGKDGVNIPSIYDGLPIDSQTIYWEDIKDDSGVVIGKILKAKIGGGTLGSLANVGEWADSVADVDRIMVQKKGSKAWEAMDASEIGSASFENIFEGGDGNAYTSFVLSGDKKSITLMKGMKFATTDDLDKRINNLINGAPAAYDTLKEIADVLQGNVNSIGDIITTLGTKWTQDDTKIANWDAAYSWGDHSKAGYAAKSYVDSTFVPIKGDCNIEGIKNFIGSLQVNGSPIVYDKEKGYWYFTGDMIVSGGITMFGNPQGFEPSTIMDGVHVDGVTIIKENGRLVALGGGGSGGSELDTVAWGNVLGKPSWITDDEPECVNPFSLSWNGRETGSYNGSMGKSFYIPAKLSELTDDVVSGKYLPLNSRRINGDGTHLILFSGSESTQGVVVGSGTDMHVRPYQRTANNLLKLGAADYRWETIYSVLGNFSGQITSTVADGTAPFVVTSKTEVANLHSATATKLHTPIKLWGNNFDGSKDITGDLYFENARTIYCKDTNGVYNSAVVFGADNTFRFGLGAATNGYNTVLIGHRVYLQYDKVLGFVLSESGNVGIGTLYPSAKLHLSGSSGSMLKIESTANYDFVTTISTMLPNLQSGYSNCIQFGKALEKGKAGVVSFRYNEDSNENLLSLGFYSDGYKLIIKGNGNVGIGTISPASKLHVNGTLGVADDASFKKNLTVLGTSSRETARKATSAQIYVNGIGGEIEWGLGVNSTIATEAGNVVNSGVGIVLGSYNNGNYGASIGRGAGIAAVAEETWHNRTGIAFYVNHYSSSSSDEFTEKMRLTHAGNLIPKHSTTQTLGSSTDYWGNTYTKLATIDGVELKKTQNDTLYINGNLVVRGGITMYGTDTTSTPSIFDALPIASTSAKGIAQFSSDYFTVSDGIVRIIDGSVGLKESELNAILDGKNYATKADLSGYLKLSGGTLTGALFIKNAGQYPVINFLPSHQNNISGLIAFDAGSSTKLTQSRFMFREYSYSSTDGTRLNNYETYFLPSASADLSSNVVYNILTSKNYKDYSPTLTGIGAKGDWNININGGIIPKAIASGDDLNNYLTNGRYHAFTSAVSKSLLNNPMSSQDNGVILDVIKDNVGALQILYGTVLGGLFTRRYAGDSWSNWTEYLKVSDLLNKIKSIDGSGSGLDADMLDGRHYSDFLFRVNDKMYSTASNPSIKLLTFTRKEEKGWLKISLTDTNNSSKCQSAQYIVWWTYDSKSTEKTVYIRCVYASGNDDITKRLFAVRQSGNTFDLYFTPVSSGSLLGYVIEGYSTSCKIDNTEHFATTTPTATYTSYEDTLITNAATATKLKTAVSLWGNTFDGSSSVTEQLVATKGIHINTSTDSYPLLISRNGDLSRERTSIYQNDLGLIFDVLNDEKTSRVFFNFSAIDTENSDGTDAKSGTVHFGINEASHTYVNAYEFQGIASSATKLQTPRTIWGQTFDGTANVKGNLTDVGIIRGTGDLILTGLNSVQMRIDMSESAAVALTSTAFRPLNDSNNLLDLGASNARWKGIFGQELNLVNNEKSSSIKHIGVNGGYALIAGYLDDEYLRIDGYNSSGEYVTQFAQLDKNGYFSISKANIGNCLNYKRRIGYTLGVYGRFGVSDDASMEIYPVDIETYEYGAESIAIQTCFDNEVPSTSDYVEIYEGRCNLLLQPRGGQVYVGYTPTAIQDKYALSVGGGDLQILKNLSVHETSTFTGATTHNAGLLSTTGSFSDSVTINGIKINKSQDGTLYLDGNLVVKGGITMYGTDATNTPSILDSLPKASYGTDDVNKGIASFDGSYFRVTDGYVSLIADSVGLNEDRLEEYLSTWSGSSNITTLGVVTNGVWNGSKIANNYLANPSLTISGKSVSLGGSISQADLRSALGLGSNAYTSTQFVDLTSTQTITGTKNFTSQNLTLSSHLYRYVYDEDGYVYDHYYNNIGISQKNTIAVLRVKSGDTFKALRFGGDGIFTWFGNIVLDAANFNSYAPTLTGGGASGNWNIYAKGITPIGRITDDSFEYFNNSIGFSRGISICRTESSAVGDIPALSTVVTLGVDASRFIRLASVKGTGKLVFQTSNATNNGFSSVFNILTDKTYGTFLDSVYLKQSSYTAADILAKLKTVDGANSGLDADTLDGNHASRFIGLYTRSDIGTAPNYDNPSVNGLFEIRATSETPNETGTKPFDRYAPFFSMKAGNVIMQIAGTSYWDTGWWIRGKQSANPTLEGVAWERLVTEDAQLNEWNIKVKSATSATSSTKAYQDGNGDVIINTYLNKNTGGTVNGIIKVNEIQSPDNYSMLAYKPTDMYGVSSNQWGAGASTLQGVIRGKGSLIHYDGSGSYTIWDSGNDGSDSGLDADMLDGLHSTSLMKFDDYTDYVRASFVSDTLAERASSKYIEFWHNDKWFNIQAGKIKAHSGFEGSLTGNADTATALSDSSSYTIFGNTFFVNGKPQSISSLSNGSWLKINNTGGTEMRLVGFNSSNQAFFGFDSRENNYDTYVDGGTLHLRSKNGYIDIASSGYVGVNKSPSYNFDVSGIIHATSDIMADGDMSADYMYANRFSINTSNYITTSGGYLSLNTASNELSISGTSNSNIHVNYRTAANGYAPSKWIWLAGSSGSYAAFSIGDLTVNGNILSTGGITMYSQRSLKNVVDERGLTLNELSVIKPTRYTWKDGRDSNIHIGGIADDIKQVLPEVVYKTEEGVLTMDYGNAGFAIAASLIKPVVDHEQRIKALERENEMLKQELNKLRA